MTGCLLLLALVLLTGPMRGPISAEGLAIAVQEFLLYLSDEHPVEDRQTRNVSPGIKPSSVAQALWAINTRHRMAGHPGPGSFEKIKTAMAGTRRRKTLRKKQQAPLTIDDH